MNSRLASLRPPTRLATALGLAFLAATTAGAQAVPARKLPTCAVVADGSLAARKSPVASMVEQRLLRSEKVEVLDRSDIDKVLDERRAQALFGSGAGVERSAAGGLLKADLVVLLRVVESNGIPALEAVVSESRRGLRLCTRTAPLTAPEADADAVEALVRQAVVKQAEKIEEVCAVPPFLDKDLVPRHDDLKRAYGKVVEQAVLDRPGVLVVELDEARALAREELLSKTAGGSPRKLPLYLLGEYRNEGDGERRRVTIGLVLRRGEARLGSVEKAGLAPADLAKFLRESTVELLAKVVEARGPEPDPEAESRQLAARAREFLSVGSWSEALALIEASLLVKPDQPKLHRDAADCLLNLAQDRGPQVADPERARAQHDFYRRALDHFEPYLSAKFFEGNDPWVGALRSISPWGPVWEGSQELVEDVLRAKRAMLLRLLHTRVRKGINDRFIDDLGDAMPWKIGVETEKDRFALMDKIIVEIQDLPNVAGRVQRYASFGFLLQTEWDSPEARDFIDRLAKSPNEGVRAGAEALRKSAAVLSARKTKTGPNAATPGGVPAADRPKFAVDSPEFLDALGQLARSDDSETRDAAETLRRKLRPSAVEEAGVGKPEVLFRTIGVGDGTRAGPVDLQGFVGCIPAGEGVDVFWAPFPGARVCMLKAGGRWSTLVSRADAGLLLGTPCFDGRYLWVPAMTPMGGAYRPPFLILIDPASGRDWEVTAKDGLPFPPADGKTQAMGECIAVAPLAPGKVLVAGSFGPAWLATASFEPGAGASVKVVHEARMVSDPGNPEPWKSTSLAFRPFGMDLITSESAAGKKGGRRVVIGRVQGNFSGHPLVFDPETRALDVVHDYVPLTDACGVVRDGAMYWVQEDSAASDNSKATSNLLRMGFPDFKPTVVAHRVYVGKRRRLGVAFDEDRPLIVGDAIWEEDTPGAGFRQLRGAVPDAKDHDIPNLVRSQNLGWLLLRQDSRPYRVQLPDRAAKP